MILDFTKIKWGGQDCVLLTVRETRQAIILTRYEIEQLSEELKKGEENET